MGSSARQITRGLHGARRGMLRLAFLVSSFLFLLRLGPAEIVSAQENSQLKPGGMALLSDGKFLAVTLSRSGEIALVNLRDKSVKKQTVPGIHCSDLMGLSNDHLAVLNRSVSRQNPVVISVLRWIPESEKLQSVSNIRFPNKSPSPPDLIHLALSPSGNLFAAATTEFDVFFFPVALQHPEKFRFPNLYSSGAICFLPGKVPLLAVPDASQTSLRLIYGNQLAENVHPTTLQHITGIVPGRNLFSGLVVSGQRISQVARSSFDDVHWGSLVSHQLRKVRVADLQAEPGGQLLASETIRLGAVGNPAPDPAAVVLGKGVRHYISLSGSDEVLARDMLPNGSTTEKRVKTGRRPGPLLIDNERDTLYVANRLGNSISVIDLDSFQLRENIELAPNPVSLTSSERGERLFFDASLSHDRWMSCHTCHHEGGSNGYLADTLTDGGYGTPKRIPDLRGSSESAPFGWTGSKPDLASQIRASLSSTMHLGREPTAEEIESLIAYLSSLPPPPPPPPPAKQLSDSSNETKPGEALFTELKCGKCHEPPVFTVDEVFDVGLSDESGQKKFNPPSLRGLRFRGAFFHDNRARSLREIFTEFGHQLDDRKLTPQEIDQLLAYLRTL